MNDSTKEPIIETLPTGKQVEKLMDEIVAPELPDRIKKEFIRFLLTIANADNEDQWALANIAAQRVFEFTFEHEAYYKKFAGLPVSESYSANEHYQTVEREQ